MWCLGNMNSKKNVYGSVCALLLGWGLVGCSPDASHDKGGLSTSDEQSLTGDLALMQGEWEGASAGREFVGSATIEGLAIILAYRHGDEGHLVRNSMSFEQIDEARGMLINEGKNAWPYKVVSTGQGDRLELEFYCNQCSEWHKMIFSRLK